jgi:thymidylate synthase (FAD)
MSKVKLIWATPNAETLIAYMARVSNPANQDNQATAPKLLRYLIDNKHWSPFEMASMCLEIDATRDIIRQMLRHRSFSFQEFSQRYAVADGYDFSEVRLQDHKNRQNSIPVQDRELARFWWEQQQNVLTASKKAYENALNAGIAREIARKVLPEGITTSRAYMAGTLRSWMHYCEIRCDPSTQKEHREVAEKCREILETVLPSLFKEQ